MTALFH